MQVAKYKYGKHCHLCACFTKDPIVRSYFRFLKYLTSLLQSFDQLYTFFYCYKLPKFICNSFAGWDGHKHYGNVNGKSVECTGKKGFPSIFFDRSLMMDDLGGLSLVLRDTATAPRCSRPGCTREPSCCSRSPLLFGIACACGRRSHLFTFRAAGFLQNNLMNHCLHEYENHLSHLFWATKKRECI